ncbi:MAG: hypothetical protein M3295_10095 [Chloroflexota bacterium]|nr:hypothetical protein [Chloroflexota bacterium]
MTVVHQHRFRVQAPGGLTLRQFVESLRRWTPEMRSIVQIALTRTDAERQAFVRAYHRDHHAREGGRMDSFIRWAYSDPRLEYVPGLLADLDRPESDYDGALVSEATTLVYLRGEGRTPAQRVRDFLNLLAVESSETVLDGFRRLLPPATADAAVVATVRLMRRRWLEVYGEDPFFDED